MRMRIAHLLSSCCAVCGAAAIAWAQHSAAEPGLADASHAGVWTTLGGDPARSGWTDSPPLGPILAIPSFVRSTDASGATIAWIGQGGIAVSSDAVFAAGKTGSGVSTVTKLYALNRGGGAGGGGAGAVLWASVVPNPVFDSAPTPSLDIANGTVLYPSGNRVRAFALGSGTLLWETVLSRSIVNASVCVTNDRAYITDYDGFGIAASIYSINTAPFDAENNPYQVGQIVWSAPIGGSSGNTPAFDVTLNAVFVATIGEYETTSGQVLAFDVAAAEADAAINAVPQPFWTATAPLAGQDDPQDPNNLDPIGFFGGLTVAWINEQGIQTPLVLASTYAFAGGMASARTLAIHGETGAILWSLPTNRTRSIPVMLPRAGNLVGQPSSGIATSLLLAGGVPGYGTVPTLEFAEATSVGASSVFQSAMNTWTDLNANSLIDSGEYTRFGGWSAQPVVTRWRGSAGAVVGTIPSGTNFAGFSTDIRTLDLSRSPAPAQNGFVTVTAANGGGSAAVAGLNIYSIGAAGLCGFGPTPGTLDINADSRISINDLALYEQGTQRDLDSNGAVNGQDRAMLVDALRRRDRADIFIRERPKSGGGN